MSLDELLNRKFSHRMGPVVGVVAGTVLSTRFDTGDLLEVRLLYGAVVGFLGGLVIYVLTHPKNKEAGPEQVSPAKIFWAIIGLLLAFVPIIGVIPALISFAINSKCRGWVRTLSLISIGISVVGFTILFVAIAISQA